MPLSSLFREHPESVGETYLEHMRVALGFSFVMTRAAACCLVHAFLPFLFQRTGSSAVEQLYRTMLQKRRLHPIQKRQVASRERNLFA